jgi:hypothetical protein
VLARFAVSATLPAENQQQKCSSLLILNTRLTTAKQHGVGAGKGAERQIAGVTYLLLTGLSPHSGVVRELDAESASAFLCESLRDPG